jgi:hypothetical protein
LTLVDAEGWRDLWTQNAKIGSSLVAVAVAPQPVFFVFVVSYYIIISEKGLFYIRERFRLRRFGLQGWAYSGFRLQGSDYSYILRQLSCSWYLR